MACDHWPAAIKEVVVQFFCYMECLADVSSQFPFWETNAEAKS